MALVGALRSLSKCVTGSGLRPDCPIPCRDSSLQHCLRLRSPPRLVRACARSVVSATHDLGDPMELRSTTHLDRRGRSTRDVFPAMAPQGGRALGVGAHLDLRRADSENPDSASERDCSRSAGGSVLAHTWSYARRVGPCRNRVRTLAFIEPF